MGGKAGGNFDDDVSPGGRVDDLAQAVWASTDPAVGA